MCVGKAVTCMYEVFPGHTACLETWQMFADWIAMAQNDPPIGNPLKESEGSLA